MPEVAHPYYSFLEAGYQVDFVTPKGGKAPVDPSSVEAFKNDAESAKFLAEEIAKTETTLAGSQLQANNYVGIFYAGGFGPMFDIPQDVVLQQVTADIYEQGKVVGAVCHGPVGLVNVKLSNGEYLVKNKTVCAFTNGEEDVVKNETPFFLEDKMKEHGANFVAASNWAANAQVSERVVTGQNPASAKPAGDAFVAELKKLGL